MNNRSGWAHGPRAREFGRVLGVLAAFLAFIFVALAVFVEVLSATPLSAAVYSVCALTWLFVFLASLMFSGSSYLKVGGALVFFMILAGLYVVPWNSRKVFLGDLHKIQPGMTVGEVEEIMDGYISGTGWPARPLGMGNPDSSSEPTASLEIEGAKVYRHSNEGRFNSDWGEIYFDHGKVTRIHFSFD